MTKKANDDTAEEANGEMREWHFGCQCGVFNTVVATEKPDVRALGCLGHDRACGIAFEGVYDLLPFGGT